VFGLQIGKTLGCRCIITSSSDTKLERVREWGADDTINYTVLPEWHRVVRELTGGLGVDQVLEVGGPGTLAQSISAVRVGGVISLIGVLARAESQPAVFPAALDCMTIHGIYVGSRAMLEEVTNFVVEQRLTPVIDRVFPFTSAKDAYEYFASQTHTGKVVIQFE
jgi:NADPH:quinone reductase-like Zn-dependent oxidoreductase